MKMGPCGGGGGNARETDLRGVHRIAKVIVVHGLMVDSMHVSCELDAVKEKTEIWGWHPAGNRSEVLCIVVVFLRDTCTLVLYIYEEMTWRLLRFTGLLLTCIDLFGAGRVPHRREREGR